MASLRSTLSVDDLKETVLDAPDDAVPTDLLGRAAGLFSELSDARQVASQLASRSDERFTIS